MSSEKMTAFPETRWSTVLRLNSARDDSSQRAFAELCQMYWKPLYTLARCAGCTQHDAEDLTQGFLAQLLRRGGVGPLTPEKGRLRSFLKTSFRNYMAQEFRRETRQKRGGGELHWSLDFDSSELQYQKALRYSGTPEDAFDRQWAGTILRNTLDSLRKSFELRGRRGMLMELEIFLGDDSRAPSYAEVAARLGQKENTIAANVRRMRQEFRELLRQEVSDTIASPVEIDEELRYLLRIVE